MVRSPARGPLSGPTSQPLTHTLTVLLEHEVRESTNKRHDADRYRRLEASVGLGITELGRNLARNWESASRCARSNVRWGVLGGRGEEGVEVFKDLDW